MLIMCSGILLGLKIQVILAFGPIVRWLQPYVTLRSTSGGLCLLFQVSVVIPLGFGLFKVSKELSHNTLPSVAFHSLFILHPLWVGRTFLWGEVDSCFYKSNPDLPSLLKTCCSPMASQATDSQVVLHILFSDPSHRPLSIRHIPIISICSP